MLNIAILYDSVSGTTMKAGELIKEGISAVDAAEAKCFNINELDEEYVKTADAVIIGGPTYMASTSFNMQKWLQTSAPKLGLAGKLGGAYATAKFVHGGAENVIETILTHEMVLGMMTYSGGGSFGEPPIHLGPVAISTELEKYEDILKTYGFRFATQLTRIKK